MHILTIFVSALLPVVIIIASTAVIAAVVYWQRRKEAAYPRHSPLTREMLRPPAYSLMKEIDETNFEITLGLMVLVASPLLVFAIHISQSHFSQLPESIFRIVVSAGAASVLMGTAIRQLLRFVNKRKLLMLGRDGEMATGEELNQLMKHGCHVFHDVPFPYGNIDHVVVSHSGVFSVNTKSLGKPKEAGNAKIIVDHDLNVINFPDRQVKIPNEQLTTESNWLAKYLTSAVGEKVEVEPMLALPGWFIEDRKGRGKVFVFNPKEPKRFFVHSQQVISQAMQTRIAHQLEQKCRDISPSYKQDKSWKSNTGS